MKFVYLLSRNAITISISIYKQISDLSDHIVSLSTARNNSEIEADKLIIDESCVYFVKNL